MELPVQEKQRGFGFNYTFEDELKFRWCSCTGKTCAARDQQFARLIDDGDDVC